MFKERLLTPGPTTIPAEVLQAMNVPMLHHRSDAFKKELRKACEGMRWLLSWDSDPIFLACSGTGALEASLLNTCKPGDSIIAVNGGVFGARWAKIAERLEIIPHEISVEWGAGVTLEQVEQAVSKFPNARAFCIQHSETSTTALHPVQAVLERVKTLRPDIITIVDGISSCATTPMPGTPAIIDIYIAGSQKGLMLPPGLSIVAISARGWEAIEATPKRSLYFDLSLERRSLAGGETSWTPASTLIVGLNEAIRLFQTEGLEAIYSRHALLSKMVLGALDVLNLKVMAPTAPCPSVTGFFTPAHVEADALRTEVRKAFGIRLAGGQGALKGKVVRIGHMGYVDPFEIVAAISAIGITLTKLGEKRDVGLAVTTALREISL
jgi:aspartate aminotransferase-like enzyme